MTKIEMKLMQETVDGIVLDLIKWMRKKNLYVIKEGGESWWGTIHELFDDEQLYNKFKEEQK